MGKQYDIKQWGQAELTLGLKVREWYRLKDALQFALDGKRNKLKKEEEKLYPLRVEIESDNKLIKTIQSR